MKQAARRIPFVARQEIKTHGSESRGQGGSTSR